MQPDITRTIPRSTKQRWKGENIHSFWTPYPLQEYLPRRLKEENTTLKVQVRSLFYLVAIYKELVALLPVKSNQVLAIRKSMERLLHYCNKNGLDNSIWRYLPCSTKQWKVWERTKTLPEFLAGPLPQAKPATTISIGTGNNPDRMRQ
jgi:hypothetical protein